MQLPSNSSGTRFEAPPYRGRRLAPSSDEDDEVPKVQGNATKLSPFHLMKTFLGSSKENCVRASVRVML